MAEKKTKLKVVGGKGDRAFDPAAGLENGLRQVIHPGGASTVGNLSRPALLGCIALILELGFSSRSPYASDPEKVSAAESSAARAWIAIISGILKFKIDLYDSNSNVELREYREAALRLADAIGLKDFSPI